MRINPVNLNQAISRSQSAGVSPVPKVIAKPATAVANAIDDDSLDVLSTGSGAARPVAKRKKRRARNNLNLDGLGAEVDVWV